MPDKLGSEFEILSHEFKTPTNIIYSTAQLVKRYNEMNLLEPEAINERMDTIMGYCDKLKRITDNILNLAAYKTGNLMLNVEPLSISKFMNDLVEMSEKSMVENDIKLKLKIKVRHDILHCDFAILELILTNLLSNAIKYSRKTRRTVSINVYEEDEKIHFAIKDNGIGIPREMIPMIFNEYYRTTNKETARINGNGLGLAIVKTFTDFLGGSIEVLSEINKGSEFIISIPRTPVNRSKKSRMIEPPTIRYEMLQSNIDLAYCNL